MADPAVAAEVSSLAETRNLSPLSLSIKLSCLKLRLIYTSDFKAQFCIKIAHSREYKLFACLENLQA